MKIIIDEDGLKAEIEISDSYLEDRYRGNEGHVIALFKSSLYQAMGDLYLSPTTQKVMEQLDAEHRFKKIEVVRELSPLEKTLAGSKGTN
ncbi:MAG: hypothetical protein AABY40_02240 [Nanoarchaeota archaeon]